MSVYRAPRAAATAELKERGSRFLAVILPARDVSEAEARLDEVRRRHADATHHCWAWRLGARGDERSSDAGEPSGTAGKPMLDTLRGAELSDVLAVVVRWFGGTKLGKGGLARAYSGAVKLALERLATEERWPTVELQVELPYRRLGALKRLIHPPEVLIGSEEYGATVRLTLVARADRRAELEEALAGLGAAFERETGLDPPASDRG